jgi:putative endonuclease
MPRWLSKLFYRLVLADPITRFYDRWLPDQSFGQRGERFAERYLLKQGFVIITRGYEDKFGEIDLIAVEDETIVFVEVKTRSSNHAGDPAEAVDLEKQKHITKTAKGYLKWHRLTECRARFDVISVLWPNPAKAPELKHYRNAFEPVGKYQMF